MKNALWGMGRMRKLEERVTETFADREDVLSRYTPIRASIRDILGQAQEALGRADLRRALKQIAPWAGEEIFENGEALEMMADIGLFEPNQRGSRVFDRFLASKAGRRLDEEQQRLAKRMSHAWFSIFRCGSAHDQFGRWLVDILNGDRRIWLADAGVEITGKEGLVVGMRVFDAGPFHAGFGIVMQPDEETLAFCLGAVEDGTRLPFRHSLAARLYSDALLAGEPADEAQLELLDDLADLGLLDDLIGTLRGSTPK